MNELIVSYHLINDWYVGEVYKYFFNELSKKYSNIKFNYIHLNKLKSKYTTDNQNDSFYSFFNHYNFIIINPKNNKTFINSLHDYPHLVVSPRSGVEYFDVQSFGLVHHDNTLDNIKKYNPKSSFYILENYSDLNKIIKYRNVNNKIDKAYFLGAIYGIREKYHSLLKESDNIIIESKHENNNWKEKDDYFDLISKYRMSFSMEGAAKICYRDIESLGIGNLLIREPLGASLFDPLIPDEHYLEIVTLKEKKDILLGNNNV
jgi:hypothetical protein